MAGTVGNTTIGINTLVDTGGLDRAQDKLNRFIDLARKAESPIKLGMEASGLSQMMDNVTKLNDSVSKLHERMNGFGTGAGSIKDISESMGTFKDRIAQATDAVKKLDAAQASSKVNRDTWKEQANSVRDYTNAIKFANNALKSQEQLHQSQQRTQINDERVAQAQMRTQQMQERKNAPMISGSHGGGGEDWHWRSKIKGGIAETAGMYSLGMLGASAVTGAGEGLKELLGAGYKYNSEQSGMQGTWRTLVEGARDEGVSARNAGSMQGITGAINDQSIRYGRSLDLTNESYQQMYHATENAGQTKHMVQSELRIADAMGMTDDQAEHFITYGVGHALERGKVSAQSLNQMNMYAPAMSGALARAVVADKQGKSLADVSEEDVNKEKLTLRDDIKKGQVNAKMLQQAVNYLGDVKFKNAAENAMHTIPGMTRAIENGAPRMMGAFEKSFMKPLEKTMGGGMYKLSKWFTDGGAEKSASNFGKKLADITNSFYKAGQAIAPLVKSFGGGFGKGFGDVFKTIQKGIGWFGKLSSSMKSTFGEKSPLGSIMGQAGKLAGMATAISGLGLAMRHIPVVGDLVNKIFSKIPLIGKLFAGNSTAGNKMMTAANTMLDAANKMNGGPGSGGMVNGRAVSGNDLTYGQRVANSGFGRKVDNMFLKGASLAEKGGIRGSFGKLLMGGATLLGKGGLKGAGLLEKLAGTGLGKIAIGGGKLLSRGGFGLNALFAGFDVANTLATTKRGSQARHIGVGSAIGGGIGGTIGAGLGSFLGPVGTVVGGVAGSWLGGKAGSAIGGRWKSIAKGAGSARKAITNFGKGLEHVPGLSGFGHVLDAAMHPIKNMKRVFSDFKSPSKLFHDIGGSVKNIGHPIKSAQSAINGFGKALKAIGVKNPLAKLNLGKEISKMGKGVSSGINKIKSSLTKGFSNAIKGVTKPFSKIGSEIGKAMNGATKGISSAINRIKSSVTKGFTTAFNGAKSAVKSAISGITSSFSSVTGKISSVISKIGSTIKTGFTNAFNSAKTALSTFGSSVQSGFGKVESIATSMVGKVKSLIGDGFKTAANLAKTAIAGIASGFRTFESAATGAVGVVKSALSGLASFASGIASKVGSALSNIHMPHFANGTNNFKGGMAVVNDGAGGNWREMYRLPNGLMGQFPNKHNLTVALPKGTQVFNGVQSARMNQNALPHFAKGTSNGAKGGVTVNIQAINVNGSDNKAIATDLVAQIQEQLQRAFAGQLDLI